MSVAAQRLRGWLRILAIVIAALLTAGLAFTGVAGGSADLGPVTASVALEPSAIGETTIGFPPFGEVSARTHAGPLRVRLALVEVDVEELQSLAAAPIPSEADVAAAIDDLRSTAIAAAARGGLAALAAAAIVAWAFTRSRRITAAIAGTTLLLFALATGLAAATFEPRAFNDPRWDGALRYAPGAFTIAQLRIADVEALQRQVQWLARDLAAYYGVPQSFQAGGSLPGTYRVLHVSDVHVDPIGMQLALDLAEAYDVALVIDTGDISHFGTEEEGALAASWATGRPHVFVPGNHDSPNVIEALRALPNVTVLERETTTTANGLTIVGVADPAARANGVEPDAAEARRAGHAVLRTVVQSVRSGEPTPTIAAVHDPASGEPFIGLVALVLSGHTHTPVLEWREGTWLLGAGTSGGVHFTELTPDPHIPHTAAILYFSRAEPTALVAIDQIEVFGKTRQSSVRRTIIDETFLDER